MNAWQDLLNRPEVERLGWTLVHSVWQGAAIALVLGLALKVLSKRSAQSRYLVASSALVMMVMASVVTYSSLAPATHTQQASKVIAKRISQAGPLPETAMPIPAVHEE